MASLAPGTTYVPTSEERRKYRTLTTLLEYTNTLDTVPGTTAPSTHASASSHDRDDEEVKQPTSSCGAQIQPPPPFPSQLGALAQVLTTCPEGDDDESLALAFTANGWGLRVARTINGSRTCMSSSTPVHHLHADTGTESSEPAVLTQRLMDHYEETAQRVRAVHAKQAPGLRVSAERELLAYAVGASSRLLERRVAGIKGVTRGEQAHDEDVFNVFTNPLPDVATPERSSNTGALQPASSELDARPAQLTQSQQGFVFALEEGMAAQSHPALLSVFQHTELVFPEADNDGAVPGSVADLRWWLHKSAGLLLDAVDDLLRHLADTRRGVAAGRWDAAEGRREVADTERSLAWTFDTLAGLVGEFRGELFAHLCLVAGRVQEVGSAVGPNTINKEKYAAKLFSHFDLLLQHHRAVRVLADPTNPHFLATGQFRLRPLAARPLSTESALSTAASSSGSSASAPNHLKNATMLSMTDLFRRSGSRYRPDVLVPWLVAHQPGFTRAAQYYTKYPAQQSGARPGDGTGLTSHAAMQMAASRAAEVQADEDGGAGFFAASSRWVACSRAADDDDEKAPACPSCAAALEVAGMADANLNPSTAGTITSAPSTPRPQHDVPATVWQACDLPATAPARFVDEMVRRAEAALTERVAGLVAATAGAAPFPRVGDAGVAWHQRASWVDDGPLPDYVEEDKAREQAAWEREQEEARGKKGMGRRRRLGRALRRVLARFQGRVI